MTAAALPPSDEVFINCPFDDAYAPTFEALIFTIYACGFLPRSARELEDSSQPRIEKLYSIIKDCRYGIHDLSRTELSQDTKLPRFNMPLELGLFLGAKRFGSGPQKQKRCLVLDIEKHRYQKFISDLSGMDIEAHGGDPSRAVAKTRDWLANVSRRQMPSAPRLLSLCHAFIDDIGKAATDLGFDPAHIPYVDFARMVTTWLIEASSSR